MRAIQRNPIPLADRDALFGLIWVVIPVVMVGRRWLESVGTSCTLVTLIHVGQLHSMPVVQQQHNTRLCRCKCQQQLLQRTLLKRAVPSPYRLPPH